VVSTIVDFTAMVIAVELGGVRPVPATVIAAACGAITNFALNRRFTYEAGHGRVTRQVWRFVLVSGASLGLNALGMYGFHNVLGVQYMIARLVTAVIVSNAWNYPMLRFFVFSHRST